MLLPNKWKPWKKNKSGHFC